ncbi:MAG: 5-amino-6-(D-ribitylamino)uracil--L-tyrosine 4-hydroxyphenyl transferase CofH [Actinomycetota bacterium]|nr:5-amino-6-(D-ribitylamino)uracil--L-tyrosine 4-hydroxyphenyl transferase CofH [Actinomycetota bacterium]
MKTIDGVLARATAGSGLVTDEVYELAALARSEPEAVVEAAGHLRDETSGPRITFSKKVFIPLTKLCRDSCGYCTFARPPEPGRAAYMTVDEVLEVARSGQAAGCKEALFTLGDKPERKWRQARDELDGLGHDSTIDYLVHACRAVFEETGLLPHVNPGALTYDEAMALRHVSVSQGTMLETLSPRLLARGMAHFGAPDKKPEVRLATLEAAGRAGVPFTTGILVGIGETFAERIDALLAIRASHESWGHIQEVIVQNFRAKHDTLMSQHPEPDVPEMRVMIALARLILPVEIGIQAPPNLTPEEYGSYLAAGLNDWGGVSPVTPDHVNPEAPWPKIDELRGVTESRGYLLRERLAVYPRYCNAPAALESWVDPKLRAGVLDSIDGEGFRRDEDWYSGGDSPPPESSRAAIEQARAGAWRVCGRVERSSVMGVLERAAGGMEPSEEEIELLFTAVGSETERLFEVADDLRQRAVGDEVTYVINRNINYTNMCYFRCGFCAFSKGPKSLNLRGEPYLLSPEEVAGRAIEAWERGATEVCMQGGIHHSFTADNYVEYLRAVKDAVPDMHVHAFTALEVWQGAQASGISVEEFLRELKEAGLATLPGTAAEILDDDIRAIICPDKINTEQWCEVHRIAHSLGLRSNATIMFGTVEGPASWARHLVVVRKLHKEVAGEGGGLFEFVPLPFVHMAAPIYLKGRSRRGPTFEEALKMHAVARLALHGHIDNIQVSWVKMGLEGAKLALQAGANDLGGTLMNENISRAAGAGHGQELAAEDMESLIRSLGRVPRRRTTLYRSALQQSAESA